MEGERGEEEVHLVVHPGFETFEAWYLVVAPRVRRALIVAAGDEALGAEASDEAFVRAFARWSRVSRMSNPDGWVFRVAVNQLRRRSRIKEVVFPHGSLPEREVTETEVAIRVDLMLAVAALPPRARQAFALRCIADLSEVETAEVMGVTAGTVSRLVHDARSRLRAQLGPARAASDDDLSSVRTRSRSDGE